MKSLIIQKRPTQFWRTQTDCPRFYLSTIEAIHQVLLEIHIFAWGIDKDYMQESLKDLSLNTDFIPESMVFESAQDTSGAIEVPYNGQFDNLLFFFSYMYDFINDYYDRDQLLSYKRPFNL